MHNKKTIIFNNRSQAQRKRFSKLKEREKIGIAIKNKFLDPQFRLNNKIRNQIRCNDPKIKQLMSVRSKKAMSVPATRKKIKRILINLYKDSKLRRSIGIKVKKSLSSPIMRQKISDGTKKAFLNPEIRKKIGVNNRGKKCYFWIDGRTPLHLMIRHSFEYGEWMRNVFKKDNYECQECFKHDNTLEAHHIKEFCIILNEFLQQYPQFSPIDDKNILIRLAITYQPFWDINNGKILCKQCHDKIKHKLVKQIRKDEICGGTGLRDTIL